MFKKRIVFGLLILSVLVLFLPLPFRHDGSDFCESPPGKAPRKCPREGDIGWSYPLIIKLYSFSQNRPDRPIVNTQKNIDSCENNDDCSWFIENQGDPAGNIHCAALYYENTCSSCERLSEAKIQDLPAEFKCECNSNKHCQESR